VICGIIKVEVSVISRTEGEADNAYRDLDNFAYRKNRIQQLFYYTFVCVTVKIQEPSHFRNLFCIYVIC
jgi:hypothetical protein